MNEYYTADTYTNWERIGKPFEKNGKLYSSVKTSCPRCGGKGIIASRVENGHIVPIPVANGICFQCSGDKFITKDVRLYTKAEYEAMQRNKERAAAKREADREAKMKAEFAHNKEVWLQTNGFSPEGKTYIYLGESYSVKDKLKKDGFHFNGGLRRWMRATPDGYEDNVVEFQFDELFDMSAWGQGSLRIGSKEIVDEKEKELIKEKPTEWIGELGKRLPAIKVQLFAKRGYQNQYGYSNIYTFHGVDNNAEIVWFSKVELSKDIGDFFSIVGTVKDHKLYNNKKQTLVNRVKIVD